VPDHVPGVCSEHVKTVVGQVGEQVREVLFTVGGDAELHDL
jgi:hypothetical protein